MEFRRGIFGCLLGIGWSFVVGYLLIAGDIVELHQVIFGCLLGIGWSFIV